MFKKHLRRSHKRMVRYGLLTANLALLIAVIVFISGSPNTADSVAQHALAKTAEDTVVANPLDQLSSADIAVHVARMTHLDESVAVVNHADSMGAQLSVAPPEETVVPKPQIVSTDLKSKKDISTYTVKRGDTIRSVARQFDVTSDSIRWSNGLSGETVAAGTKLTIPPPGVNGIVYKVRSGDTVDKLVDRFNANRDKLIEMNDAEVGGLKAGERIIIPDGIQPVRPPIRSFVNNFTGISYTPAYSGNGYDYGWCTWHAANRRRQVGKPLPSNLGNAISWYSLAQRAGMAVGAAPRKYAVLWHANMGGLGHVAFVEKINADGSILVSDMNYPIWGGVTTRTVKPSEFGAYRFIY